MSALVPIEIRLEGEGAVRGHEYRQVGPPVVFVHEPGRDLDAWGSVPSWVAQKGFKVIALDLPGHGLSDGAATEWEPMLAEAIGEIASQWGPIGVCAAGDACRWLPRHGSAEHIPVQVWISPQLVDAGMLRRASQAIRLVMSGPADSQAHDGSKAVFEALAGQKAMISGGGTDQGTDLIVEHRHLAEDVVMWFRRYLTPYHLSWIKELTDTKASEQRSRS